MIVSILVGGIGNQMFQYAMARAMADRVGTDVVLNKKLGFVRDKDFKRQYALSQYRIRYKENRFLSFDFPLGDLFEKVSRRMGFHILCPWYKYIYNDKMASELKINPSKYKNIIISGYYVKVEYFDDVINNIRSDFSIIGSLPTNVHNYIRAIEGSCKPVIMIGVRLYQEIKDPIRRNNGFFYVEADFYNRAMAYCVKKYGDVKFFIFTQGRQWVEENVNIKQYDCEFVETGATDVTAYYDLAIMSKCQCYIISNSTYYWWGAMLNPDYKEVIVPNNWTNSTLPEWTRL